MELHEAGFVYGTRVRVEEDEEGNVVKRQMPQLWFEHLELLNAAARFCSDFLLVIDGTFTTAYRRQGVKFRPYLSSMFFLLSQRVRRKLYVCL